MSSDLRIFVDEGDSAQSIVNQIKWLYPDIKKEKEIVNIQITLRHNSNPILVQEIGEIIVREEILEFRDRLFFDSI